jgi:hypothetical protein
MKKLLGIIILIASCSCSRKSITYTTEAINYINVVDSFNMRIIYYIPSDGCGNIPKASASSCIGIRKDNMDTIRVLSLCNKDTTFKTNQDILVFPYKKPTFSVSFPLLFTIEMQGKNFKLLDYRFKGVKTIFGTLKKID